MLNDIRSVEDNIVLKIKIKKKKILLKKEDGSKKRGVSDYWLDVRKRGGGSFRCVLCATAGEGLSKNRGKNAYVINGRPHTTCQSENRPTKLGLEPPTFR